MREHEKQLSPSIKKKLSLTASAIRQVTVDTIEHAQSGHIGLPLGCAEIGAYLYGYFLRHNPSNPKWISRDRFILSAGHGVLLQYICLHLSGYSLSLQDIQQYRKGGSKTPSHPQYGITEGIETTTGADGHGVANGIGQALGLQILSNRLGAEGKDLIDNKVVILAGDGCMMEGISAEASSLAGHFQLNNLILIYDSNDTTLDGYVHESFSEDVVLRYKSYGWDSCEIDGHDVDQIHCVLDKSRSRQERPLLIIAKTTIGRGLAVQGTPKAHNYLLDAEEALNVKKELKVSCVQINSGVYSYFSTRRTHLEKMEQQWNEKVTRYLCKSPESTCYLTDSSVDVPSQVLQEYMDQIKYTSISGRDASQKVLGQLTRHFPRLLGGSADLGKSDGTFLNEYKVIQPPYFTGRNIKYGVREFAMGAMAIGLEQTGWVPFIGTFLVFSDYLRHSIRMAALMQAKVFYQFTHDSILIGEDGPTHQPIEHIASLRAIPHLQVIRPADMNEVKMAWIAALKWDGPTALILSRQSLPTLDSTKVSYEEGLGRGAYIIRKEKTSVIDYTLFATGSEVHLAIEVCEYLEGMGYSVRVVSVPCWEIFDNQSEEYRNSILAGDLGMRVSIEAGCGLGWHKYIGYDGVAISVEDFGVSGSREYLRDRFDLNVESIVNKILKASGRK